MLAPIVLLLYNRLPHTIRTTQALQQNELAQESVLYVFCDGPKPDATKEEIEKVREVQEYAKRITGFKEVHLNIQETNKGLANSTIDAISEVIFKHGKVIMVEDDSLTNPFFLRYMNEALDFYKDDDRIFCISAMTDKIEIPHKYDKDILVVLRFGAWGFATWVDRWKSAEWNMTKYSILNPAHNNKKEISRFCRGGEDLWSILKMQANGELDSWAIRWQYNMYTQKKLCLRPVRSFVTNIGCDGTGIHCGITKTGTAPSTDLYNEELFHIRWERGIKTNNKIISNYQRIYASPKESFYNKMKRIGKRILHPFLQKLRKIQGLY